MSLTWSRGRFYILLGLGAEQGDTGLRTGHVSGPFGAHAAPPNTAHRRKWRLTHIPSGKQIAGEFVTLAEAQALTEKILPLADWTQKNPLAGLDEEQRLVLRCNVDPNWGEEEC